MNSREPILTPRIRFRLWLDLRVTLPVLRALRWLFRCPECHTRPDRHRWSKAPRWDHDKVAAMLGIVEGRCPRCGAELERGAS
jgi:hypothetical protein